MMSDQERATSAMLGSSATREQAYSIGPGWAAYRLPFTGINQYLSARECGVAFDGENGDDAGAAGATSGSAGGTSTGDDDPAKGSPQLGEAGRRAIEAEREAARLAKADAKAARDELDALKAAGQTEVEKAIAKARQEAAAEVQAKADQRVRMAEVRRALAEAGCVDAEVVARSPEFGDLAVDDEGRIPDLAKAVGDYQKAHKALFARASNGSGDGGARGGDGAPQPAKTLTEAATRHYEQNPIKR